MNYQDFLFSQLFMRHIENNSTQYQDLEYDLIYPEVIKHKELYINSNFNVYTKGEYECIINYLTNTI
jgi:hypothetical protein